MQHNASSPSTLDQWVIHIQPFLRHFTLTRFLILLTLITAFIAWNRGIALLYAVVAILITTLILSFLGARWQVRALSMQRRLPLLSLVGEPVVIEYHFSVPSLKAKTQQHRFLIQLSDTIQALSQPNSDKISLISFLPRLTTHQPYAVTQYFHQRGIYQFQSTTIMSAYPFGIVRQQRYLLSAMQQISVLPAFYSLNKIVLPKGQSMNSTQSPAHIGHDEFHQLRPFQPQDALKHIHWAKSAQSLNNRPMDPQLISKSYHDANSPTLTICLPQGAGLSAAQFESALSIAASFAQYCYLHHIPCMLYGEFDQQTWLCSINKTAGLFTYLITPLASLSAYSQHYKQHLTQAIATAHTTLLTFRHHQQATPFVPDRLGHIDICFNDQQINTLTNNITPHRLTYLVSSDNTDWLSLFNA